jgi:hypothetical protein
VDLVRRKMLDRTRRGYNKVSKQKNLKEKAFQSVLEARMFAIRLL